MNIIQNILTKNDCYRLGRTITPKGIIVHSTGANQKNIQVYTSQWNRSGVSKCVHAFIGLWNGSLSVVQTLPWYYRCWGCGKGRRGTYNDSRIQFEICEDNKKDPVYFNQIYNKAVELCAFLCKKYNIPVKNVVCHSEAHALGYASNHADVMHWFPLHGKNMDKFRSAVQAAINGSTPEQPKKFAPNQSLTRGQMITFLYKMAGSPSVSGAMPFVDVPKDKYYYNAVLWAKQNGISNGTTSTTFSPEKPCSRGEFVTMLYNFAGKPTVSVSAKYIDVPQNAFYAKAVSWATANGIATGTTSTTFSPLETCTRGQAVTMLYNYKGKPNISISNPFSDISPNNYYYKPAIWAYENKITSGV